MLCGQSFKKIKYTGMALHNKKSVEKAPVIIPGLKEIFGAVVSHPDRFGGRPFLTESGVEVREILALFKEGLTDKEIGRRYRKQGLKPREIEACRAYQARFLPETLSDKFNRVGKNNVFLLDENIPYRALYDVVRLFGRSSHARADGLYDEHNDDEKDIWQHAVGNKYAAVMTADADFLRISQYYRNHMIEKYGSLKKCPEHVPALIYFKRPLSMRDTIELLEIHQDEIRRFMKDNDAVYLLVGEDGCKKIYSHTHGKGMGPASAQPGL
jgi:uncharacterized protein (DUF433 family)